MSAIEKERKLYKENNELWKKVEEGSTIDTCYCGVVAGTKIKDEHDEVGHRIEFDNGHICFPSRKDPRFECNQCRRKRASIRKQLSELWSAASQELAEQERKERDWFDNHPTA